MYKLTNSPFLDINNHQMIDVDNIRITSFVAISSYKSMATDTPYQVTFEAKIKEENIFSTKLINVIYADLLEAISLLKQKQQFLSAYIVEKAYFYLQNQINFEND